MNVLVTGASGYIGTALCQELVAKGHSVRGVGRTKIAPSNHFDYISFDLESDGVYELVKEHDCIVHLAGRAHMLGETASTSADIYRQANSDLSVRLAKSAIEAGVKRFVFISSIGVNGSFTHDRPFSESSMPDPTTPYAISKYTAENELQALVSESPMELVIIRPPLVYAGNAPGNFLRLIKLVSIGVPLPFGAVQNSRSMIALENLVDFIQVCMVHPAAAGELFVVSDNQEFSTPEIVRYLAQGMHKNIILLPFFDSLMRVALPLFGKQSIYSQLYGSLVIDSSKARSLLDWTPPRDARQCLIDAGNFFKSNVGK
ncbi:NAD-dependent epimerase/dehydratase family protein [Pseudomonas tussilaginis]|uniref:NAD-dependent epimerase/dehydratase family protein n=1 Tax=Pseudomonas putida TaxID=303 RepID=UPI002363D34F|nr:NAD-dependent epimerase/dehydratase family protein [Pseudomonas putida]MDD1976820.1 NAD-dependent epimerase/dehydratase family protein [Pseudomonas putida]